MKILETSGRRGVSRCAAESGEARVIGRRTGWVVGVKGCERRRNVVGVSRDVAEGRERGTVMRETGGVVGDEGQRR
ncbi:hypothetical protein [Candidatus Solincola sp.]|nr:hypothetical protein [Actinomycetota bacterium]MDI7251857.1 hypothetical protein [Actinomycetota bacterium]